MNLRIPIYQTTVNAVWSDDFANVTNDLAEFETRLLDKKSIPLSHGCSIQYINTQSSRVIYISPWRLKWSIMKTRLYCLPFWGSIFHHDAVNQITKLTEVFTQWIISRRVAQTADEQLTKLFWLSSCSVLVSTKHTIRPSMQWHAAVHKTHKIAHTTFILIITKHI